LSALHVRNFRALRGWTERAKQWSTLRKAWDVAISFLIPSVILLVVFSQIKAFYGYRFNLTYQMIIMSRTLGDIAVLMLVGSIPDYVQGLVKLYWVVREKTRRTQPLLS
jgi:hypothetical protein